jgi:2'-hydroxyisoflavone reductase
MKILILGGTGFLGPHVVEYAVSRQHTVTLFNRGRTRPEFFPDLEKLRGDRNDDLSALEGRSWDAVIDTSANVPRWVRSVAELLGGRIRQYVFVSSVSVYDSFAKVGIDETDPVGTLEDETTEQVTGATFGPLKAACERAAETLMPGRVTVVRPGLIVGPLDNSDRFTYWPVRIDRGGEVLAPAPMETPVQYIDARDLARFIVGTIEDGHVGIYNALGPTRPLTMAETLHGIRAVTSSDVQFTWVDGVFLAANEVSPWMELPLWVPAEGEMLGFARVSNERARSIGLTFRPLADTARDTLAWAKTRGADYTSRAGLAAEKERQVLQAWRAR